MNSNERKERRGFASMSPERQREIAKKKEKDAKLAKKRSVKDSAKGEADTNRGVGSTG